ncbi:uncharacterized protein LOC117117417 [Anneissia japonica]|uniref:uncharacterized protein LOC117117417 n=1 Tax=Anneissia japonica TaxID=1529436 RepID=UPI001425A76C|nr:uncharacterized protein LOC117117417 [Anneissia japonica]
MVSVTTCDNATDIASCFRLADCECCLRGYQLALRCYGGLHIKSLLTVGRSIGLVNDEFCNITLSPDHHLRYGNISIPRVAPFTWNCPSSGSGTLENCSRKDLTRNRNPLLLTKKCQIPADKRLPNYSLCYDNPATREIHTSQSSGKKCEMHCSKPIPSTASSTVSLQSRSQGRGSAQQQLKYALPIGGVLIVVAAVFAIALVWKRRNRLPVTIDFEEDNTML